MQAIQGKPSQTFIQSIFLSHPKIPDEKQTRSKHFEGQLKHVKIISPSENPLNLPIDGLEETKGVARPPYNDAHHCTHCPYFSSRKNDMNTHILAYHRQNSTDELSFHVENFIESCELPYLESPMDHNQVSETTTNQDFHQGLTRNYI